MAVNWMGSKRMLIKHLHDEHPLQPRMSPSIIDNSSQSLSQPSAAADRRLQKAFFAQQQTLKRPSSSLQHQDSSHGTTATPIRASSLPVGFSRAKLSKKEEKRRGSRDDDPWTTNSLRVRKMEEESDASSSAISMPVQPTDSGSSVPPGSSKRRRLLSSGSWSKMQLTSETSCKRPSSAPNPECRPRLRTPPSQRQSQPPKLDVTFFDTDHLRSEFRRSLSTSLSASTSEQYLPQPPPVPPAPFVNPPKPAVFPKSGPPPSTSQPSQQPRILAHALGHRPGQFAKRKLEQAGRSAGGGGHEQRKS
ncbi:hypothetical protein CF319_g2270 [Tilletia indica]|nr:hypothetical protein CF319_g2270 [Tilletia indica]